MATAYCKYHSESPARWYCTHCSINFCSRCASSPDARDNPACPVCQHPLHHLGMGNAIPPFWSMLHKIFLYPLDLGVLLLLLPMACLSGIVGKVSWLLLLVFYRYAYAALEETALGHREPPAVTIGLIMGELSLPLKQLLIMILSWGLLLLAAIYAGLPGFIIAALLIFIWLPASIMELATSHRLFSAINPVLLTGTIRAIGWPYALLWLFLFMLSVGGGAFQSYFGHGTHGFILRSLFALVDMYFLLVMFHLMGYVIYQYHEALGYPVEVDIESPHGGPANRSAVAASPGLDQVAILLQEGKSEEAKSRLKSQLDRQGNNLGLHRQYHKLLVLMGDKEALSLHTPQYLDALIAQNQAGTAAEVWRDSRKIVPDLALKGHHLVYPLVRALKTIREPKLLVQLANGFHVQYPKHEDLPAIYFLTAQTLNEELGQAEQARKVLRFLQEKFPEHESAEQIRRYLAQMDQGKA